MKNTIVNKDRVCLGIIMCLGTTALKCSFFLSNLWHMGLICMKLQEAVAVLMCCEWQVDLSKFTGFAFFPQTDFTENVFRERGLGEDTLSS